jgi:O-antigen/teichoic acid export membrane protein
MTKLLLNQQMATAAMWAGISSAGNQILSLVVFILIARLVTPSEFGVVALAVLLIDLTQIVSGAGLSEAAIQRRELEEKTADTAFWANLGFGMLFACTALLLAAPVAALFATPELEHVIDLLSVTFLITGLGNIHTARLIRNFGFRALAARNLIASLLSGSVGIGVAVAGGGADALVAQRIVAVLCMTLISWWSFRWIPRLRFDPRAFRELTSYGLRNTGAQLVVQTNGFMLELMTGLLLGPAAVGMLRIARRSIDTLTQLTIASFEKTVLPVLARVQSDRAAGQAAYLGLSRLSAFVSFPAFVGTFCVAPIAVTLLFGEQWAEAGLLMQVVCLAFVGLQLTTPLPAALGAAGHPGDALVYSSVQLVLTVVLLRIGAEFGLAGMIAFNALRGYLALPLGLHLLRRRTGITARMVLGSIARPLAAALLMAVPVELASRLLLPLLPAWAVLLACTAVGAVAYLGLSLLFNRSMVIEAISLLPRPIRVRLGRP